MSIFKCLRNLKLNQSWKFMPDHNPKHTSKVCIYPMLPPWSGCNIRSIFKQRKAGLNSEFSF